MKILVTGGAGYIGSHTAIELLEAGHQVIIADNLSNSNAMVIKRIEQIAAKAVQFYQIDLCDKQALSKVFEQNQIDAVVHLAAFKAVGESCEKPIMYYYNNLTSMLVLLQVMQEFGVKNIVFSSSATVYGDPKRVPICEEDVATVATNPYGSTKLVGEQILTDLYAADPSLNIAILRYFNPIGSHPSGKIGEDPKGIPNNVSPYITKVIIGERPQLNIFGNDYNTPDGTGVRDYVHVVDLAKSNLLAINKLAQNSGLFVANIGSGCGASVLDLVKSFSKAANKPIPYAFMPRRPGDIDASYSDISKAKQLLGYQPSKTLDNMCADAWNWQKNNPKGYQ